jgi:predicted DNA-binding transcriptional regulator AlpA
MTEITRPTFALALLPRGLSRVHAAAYLGISPSLFDQLVKDGRMPGPKRVNARVIWDRLSLDRAFDLLPGDKNSSDDDWLDVAV